MKAQEIKALRARLGISQRQMADLLGTVPEVISRWENNHARPRRMAQNLLRKMAEFDGLTDVAPHLERARHI